MPTPPLFLLDTNILLYAMRGDDPGLIARLEGHDVGELLISAITLGELEHGWRAGHGDRADAGPFLNLIPVLPFDAAAAAGFGRVMAGLPRPKRRTYDRQIAGHALSLGLPVVTSNRRDFADVAGLIVQDWVTRPG